MTRPRSLEELIVATAHHKAAAAQARRLPDQIAEKPRDAIIRGLRIVADSLAGDGFVFYPTRPKFSRKAGDLTFEIHVQSDRNNSAGARAVIWVHLAVYSTTLTAWRKRHHSQWIQPKASFPQPFVGGQIGNFRQPVGWMEWNFADAERRERVADELIVTIREAAYTLFAVVEQGLDTVVKLAGARWPGPEGVLEYLLSQGASDLAQQVLDRYLISQTDFAADFDVLRCKFMRSGVPNFRTSLPHDLAAFAVATDYPWAVPKR